MGFDPIYVYGLGMSWFFLKLDQIPVAGVYLVGDYAKTVLAELLPVFKSDVLECN